MISRLTASWVSHVGDGRRRGQWSLHYLILLEQTELLRRFYGKVLVPDAVAGELQAPRSPQVVKDWMSRLPPWMEIADVTSDEIALISEELDVGERAAIVLAERVRADLILIDEVEGRAEAVRRSFRVTGTLGVLRVAAVEGLIDVPDTLNRLAATNFYADVKVITRVFGEWLDG